MASQVQEQRRKLERNLKGETESSYKSARGHISESPSDLYNRTGSKPLDDSKEVTAAEQSSDEKCVRVPGTKPHNDVTYLNVSTGSEAESQHHVINVTNADSQDQINNSERGGLKLRKNKNGAEDSHYSEGRLSESEYEELAQSRYMNRVIQVLGRQSLDRLRTTTVVQEFIKDKFINPLEQKMKPWIPGTGSLSGSIYEGCKAGLPNEFDAVFSVPGLKYFFSNGQSEYQEKNVKLLWEYIPRSKQRQHYPKTLLKIKYDGDNTSNPWGRYGNDGDPLLLDSEKIQKEFQNIVESTFFLDIQSCQVRGPAVTISVRAPYHLKIPGLDTISIDLVLSIDLQLTLADSGRKGIVLHYHDKPIGPDRDSIVINEDKVIPMCGFLIPHLVVAGELWRLSFGQDECQMVKKEAVDYNKRVVFVALKYLRDSLDLRHENESNLLGTYPLKIAFLEEICEHDNWEDDTTSQHAMSILKRVDEGGAKGELVDLVLKREPIVNEHDKCFLESRRMLLYLRGIHKTYKSDVWRYFIISFLYFSITFGLFVYTITYYIGKKKCNTRNKFWVYMFSSMFLSTILFIVYFIAFMWDVFHFWKRLCPCSKSSSVLTRMLLKRFVCSYIVRLWFLLAAFVLFLLSFMELVEFLSDKQNAYKCSQVQQILDSQIVLLAILILLQIILILLNYLLLLRKPCSLDNGNNKATSNRGFKAKIANGFWYLASDILHDNYGISLLCMHGLGTPKYQRFASKIHLRCKNV